MLIANEIEKIKTAVILGAGNVAWHLGHALHKRGIKIHQVFNRTPVRGKNLAESLGALYISSVNEINRHADLYILTVSDDAIANVAASMGFLQSGLLVHTSGSVPVNVLSAYAGAYGVIYPLQTFTKDREIDFKNIPLLVEGCSDQVNELLHSLAAILSEHVFDVNSRDRLIMHCAAVISANFSNYLLLLAGKIVSEHGLSFELLQPLMIETISKAFKTGPAKAQTGPARRGNRNIIEKHLELLETWPEIRKVYEMLSYSIMQQDWNNQHK